MKPSGKKTGKGREEAENPNNGVLSDEKPFRRESENERKLKKKHRDAKSRRDTANHATEIENELAQMRQRVFALTGQVDETNSLLGEVLQASADLEAALKEMKERRAESEAREEALERALELAERANQARKQQVADLHAVLSRERQQAAEMSDTIAALRDRLMIEQDHISALTVRASTADANSTRDRLQVESLNAILAATESKFAEELTRATLSESELRVTHRRYEALKRDLEVLQATLAKEQLHSSDLAQDLATAAEALARAAQTENALRIEHRRYEDMNREFEVLQATLETNKTMILERHEREINALLNSTSWRLSAPWRAFKRQVSRLRRLAVGKKGIPLFDRDWYLQRYPDVRESEIDPYDHYLKHGAIEGRDPNPFFDTDWYLQQNSDVRDSGLNPLIYFYFHGAAEGRDPHPLFSNRWFIQQSALQQGRSKGGSLRWRIPKKLEM